MISQKARYAFKALTYMAARPFGTSFQIQEIADKERIPRKFLEHILRDLRNHGLIASRRGRGGGYHLLKRPHEITMGSVLLIIDGPIAPLACLSRSAYRPCADCPDEKHCAVRGLFAEVFAATILTMDAMTLADAEKYRPAILGAATHPAKEGDEGAEDAPSGRIAATA